MKNIAIPIGISNFAAHTLRYGFDLAHYFGATVYLIDAYPPIPKGSSHMQNVHALAEDKNFERIKSLAQSNNPQQVPVKSTRFDRKSKEAPYTSGDRLDCRGSFKQ